MLPKVSRDWWSNAVIYQIWPYSYKSKNDQPTGDLEGMIQQLDYVKLLGADAIWVSPIFKSPGKDKGYDVSDYKDINPLFGNIAIAERFIDEAHKRGLRVLFDMVVNHTSEEHYWFKDAKNKKDSPYRDYYIWHKGKGKDQPPNNWQSIFTGSAWTYNEATDDWYLHCFDTSQPDINWKNPKLRDEIFSVVKFWMDKGVDGWRVDAICCINKNPNAFVDNIPDGGDPWVIDDNLHTYIQELCAVVRGYEGAIVIGEIGGTGDDPLWKYTAASRKELTAAIMFDVVSNDFDWSQGIGKFAITGFNMSSVRSTLSRWYVNSNGSNIALHIQSHDQPRVLSRWGNDSTPELHNKSGKMLAIFNQMMRGVPLVYQGEEIGMTNWKFNIDQIDDIEIKRSYIKYVIEEKRFTEEEFLKRARYFSRDNSRTPVQWDDSENAGFSKMTPWLPVNDNYKTVNFKNALADQNSIFYFYQHLIYLRKIENLITEGDLWVALVTSEKVLGYLRTLEEKCLLVICNFYADEQHVKLSDICFDFTQVFEVLAHNYEDINIHGGELILQPYESFVIKGKVTKQHLKVFQDLTVELAEASLLKEKAEKFLHK